MKLNKHFLTVVFLLSALILSMLFFPVTFKNTIKVSAQELTLEHLCFNTLMAFPDKALNSKNKHSTNFDEEKITIYEFTKILHNLYLNNYALVNINDIIDMDNLSIRSYIPSFPENKKPLLLSFDNVTYRSNYQNHGEIDKIIIDRNNQLATYTTKKSIQDRIQYDNEFLVILEKFISDYPDFSFNNARGIILFSGEYGLLGYNTNFKNANSKYEIERVTNVIEFLKSKGWTFGSNNYKYTSDLNKSEIEFKKELTTWQREVSPIIGGTNIYSFPKGIIDKTKLEELSRSNYQIIFYNSFEDKISKKANQILLPRKNVCGLTLRNNSKDFKHLFDCKTIYDSYNRQVPYEKQETVK